MGWWARKIEGVKELQLYNIISDKEEKHNLVEQYAEKVQELMLLIKKELIELGDNNRIGRGARFFDNNSATERALINIMSGKRTLNKENNLIKF